MTKEEIQAMIGRGRDGRPAAGSTPVWATLPPWARTVQKAVDEGVLGETRAVDRLTDDNLVNLQMLRNLGLLDGGGA